MNTINSGVATGDQVQEIFKLAKNKGFALPAVNVISSSSVNGVLETAKELNARVTTGNNRIAKISIVGVGMRSHAGIASRMFELLALEGINILMISTSEIKVSVVVDEKYLELGVRALHDGFELESES